MSYDPDIDQMLEAELDGIIEKFTHEVYIDLKDRSGFEVLSEAGLKSLIRPVVTHQVLTHARSCLDLVKTAVDNVNSIHIEGEDAP